MHALTELIFRDMKPALGVTEPGAVAFCAARARSLAGGELRLLRVSMNSGMYKNAYTCGIPNSAFVGLALGGAQVGGVHGINGLSPEDTMRNMGRIADPGMIETEKTILGIQAEKRV